MTACTYLKRLSSTDCEKMFASRTQTSRVDDYRSKKRPIHQRCHSMSNSLIPLFNSICRQPTPTSTFDDSNENDQIISPVAIRPLKYSQSLSYISISKKFSNDCNTTTNLSAATNSSSSASATTTTTSVNINSNVSNYTTTTTTTTSSEKLPLMMKYKPIPIKSNQTELQYDPAVMELLEIFTQKLN